MDPEQHIEQLLRWVQDTPSALEGSAVATQVQRLLMATVPKLAELKSGFMRLAVQEGWTLEEIGEACDISRQRVEQIVSR
jgi:DNA-directed RNA polymerase sigma subunit (sigma70/sigma32)